MRHPTSRLHKLENTLALLSRGMAILAETMLVVIMQRKAILAKRIAIDLRDIIADIRLAILIFRMRILKLQNLFFKITIVFAHFERDSIIEDARVFLRVRLALGEMENASLRGVAAARVAAVGLVAALEDQVEVALVDEAGVAAVGLGVLDGDVAEDVGVVGGVGGEELVGAVRGAGDEEGAGGFGGFGCKGGGRGAALGRCESGGGHDGGHECSRVHAGDERTELKICIGLVWWGCIE